MRTLLSRSKKWLLHILHSIKSTAFTTCTPNISHKEYFAAQPPSEESNRIPIVLCMWNRIENMPRIINSLNKQIGVNIELFIWNNNPKYRNEFSALIDSTPPDFPITITHSKKNIGGFGRFYLGQSLAKQHPYIVTLDDDQSINEDFVKTLLGEARSQHIFSTWAFNFFDGGDYWSKKLTPENSDADYCGTGGAIFDSSIFNDKDVFNCPKRYWFIEDLWISFIAKRKGWTLKRSAAKMQILGDGKDQHSKIYDLKNFFLNYLRKLDKQVYSNTKQRKS